MKNKLVAVLLGATVLALVFTGCGSSSSSSSSSSSDSSSTTEETTVEEEAPAEDVDWGDLEMECDPKEGYEEYALVDYTIEDVGAEFVATVSKKGDNEYDIKCVFYGDDQDWEGTYNDDGTVTTSSDLTGFMEGDAPNIIKAAIDQDKWAAIE